MLENVANFPSANLSFSRLSQTIIQKFFQFGQRLLVSFFTGTKRVAKKVILQRNAFQRRQGFQAPMLIFSDINRNPAHWFHHAIENHIIARTTKCGSRAPKPQKKAAEGREGRRTPECRRGVEFLAMRAVKSVANRAQSEDS
ncbi:MAG TPA: hypothetical protein VN873_19570 [Candidatus Angelobacter sp.]|nr:hypothetical protein [Candidatus Angelobacter sp.]